MWLGPFRHHDANELICEACTSIPRGEVRTWHGPHAQRKSDCNSMTLAAGLCVTHEVPDNTPIFTLRTTAIPACWPQSEVGPLGLPLTCANAPDNCCWQSSRCDSCGAWRLVALATRDIAIGELVIGPPPPYTTALPTGNPTEYKLSFGGGARHSSGTVTLSKEGPRAAAAGAILWGGPDHRGRRRTVAQIVLAAPRMSSSRTAEALGLKIGLALAYFKTGHPDRLEVMGDNLPVLRVAAGNGKIRTPEVWQVLETPLMHTATYGWDCEWVAVRRTYNSAADQLATIGTCNAVDAAHANTNLDPWLEIWEENQSSRSLTESPWHPGWRIERAAEPFWAPIGQPTNEEAEP